MLTWQPAPQERVTKYELVYWEETDGIQVRDNMTHWWLKTYTKVAYGYGALIFISVRVRPSMIVVENGICMTRYLCICENTAIHIPLDYEPIPAFHLPMIAARAPAPARAAVLLAIILPHNSWIRPQKLSGL